jgi:Holliday junction resolvase RusA-like endonuclease
VTAPELVFFVPGDPAPQGNKSAGVNPRTGRVVVLEGRNRGQRERFHGWRQLVSHEAWLAMTRARRQAPITGPVEVCLDFVMRRPQSAARSRRRWKTTSPDLDKLTRAVLDGLKGGAAIGDDNQVCRLVATKVMAWPDEPTGVHVQVRSIDHTAAPGARPEETADA